jgi:hypothetical protein
VSGVGFVIRFETVRPYAASLLASLSGIPQSQPTTDRRVKR